MVWYLLLYFLFSFVTIILVFFVIVLVYPPRKRKAKKMKELAEQEFHNARGKHHLQQLLEAENRIGKALEEEKKLIEKKRKKIKSIKRKERKELTKQAEKMILVNHFHEVEGLGTSLSDKIKKKVFKSRLKDLRSAHRIKGVGDSRQKSINRWVNKYEKRVPKLLEENFPGKQQIMSEFAQKISQAEDSLTESTNRLVIIEARLNRIKKEISKLQKVSLEDFILAKEGLSEKEEEIAYYLKGVFGEWEDIPVWYKEVLEQ